MSDEIFTVSSDARLACGNCGHVFSKDAGDLEIKYHRCSFRPLRTEIAVLDSRIAELEARIAALEGDGK